MRVAGVFSLSDKRDQRLVVSRDWVDLVGFAKVVNGFFDAVIRRKVIECGGPSQERGGFLFGDPL